MFTSEKDIDNQEINWPQLIYKVGAITRSGRWGVAKKKKKRREHHWAAAPLRPRPKAVTAGPDTYEMRIGWYFIQSNFLGISGICTFD